jgi:hypothetical protein
MIKHTDDNNEVTSTTANMPSKWQFIIAYLFYSI